MMLLLGMMLFFLLKSYAFLLFRCLLLVVVAIINNTGSYIIALYAFLTVVAWGLMLLFLVRPLLVRFVKASGDTVSQLGFFMIISLVFASGWFTESVGVHAIFGAFLVGLITPRENGFAVKIAEKIEDLVTIILLPLVLKPPIFVSFVP